MPKPMGTCGATKMKILAVHHLNDLRNLGYIIKCPEMSDEVKQCYKITEEGTGLKTRYDPFLAILENCVRV